MIWIQINHIEGESQHCCEASENDIAMNDLVQKKLLFVDYVTVLSRISLVISITPVLIV